MSTSDTRPAASAAGSAPTPSGGQTVSRWKSRRKAAPLAKIGMAVFAVGLLAIFADMILFAAGSRNLPLWVNLTAMLAPLGFGLGLIAVVLENKNASKARVAGRAQ